MNYTVDPGLYALGSPGADAHVFVSANYKMSFDALRSALPGIDAWILVLDTRGVNVWCAAGKGTFGTEELVRRIALADLGSVVRHRTLILPQLAAPGIAAHLVKRLSGFTVRYGPIEAADVPSFLKAGMKASPRMRYKSFTFRERLVLVPMELIPAVRPALIVMPVLLLASGFFGSGSFMANLSAHGLYWVLSLFVAIVCGAAATPLLLPWLPGRAFSVKGFVMGLIASIGLTAMRLPALGTWADSLEAISWFFIVPAVSAFLAMNFTGASTCTSLSGVRKEMRFSLPLQIGACTVGLLLLLGGFAPRYV